MSQPASLKPANPEPAATEPVSPQQILRSPRMLLAFGFGSGLSPIVPGTCGTLAALPFYLLLAQLPLWLYAIVVVVAFALGVYLCSYTSRVLGVHDHKGIVWDEFVGLWITMFMAPISWPTLMLGFVLFRFFDMVKPWPISWLDRHVHGGFGIMIDDVLAGIAACICLQAIIYFV